MIDKAGFVAALNCKSFQLAVDVCLIDDWLFLAIEFAQLAIDSEDVAGDFRLESAMWANVGMNRP